MNNDKCFICQKKLPTSVSSEGALSSAWRYDCPRCGLVYISSSVVGHLSGSENKDKLHVLSGVLRWRKVNGIINYDMIKTTDLLDILKGALIPQKLTDKFDLLLSYLGKKTSEIGMLISINPGIDYPITFSKQHQEFEEVLKIFEQEERYVERSPSGEYKLTRHGLSQYYSLGKSEVNSKQCFIAMNFDNEFDPVFAAMREVLDAYGYKTYRTKGFSIEDVNDLIIAGIKESVFIIADFTGQKEGVYFEAGFAKGLGKKVIWTCRKDDEGNLHFDTRQFNHIFWTDIADLKRQLDASIRANIL